MAHPAGPLSGQAWRIRMNDQELPILPLRDVVVFPAMVTPLIVSRPRSMKLVEEVAAGDKTLCLVAQRDAGQEDPAPEGLFAVGTVAMILKMLKFPDGSDRVIVQGVARVRLGPYFRTEPSGRPTPWSMR